MFYYLDSMKPIKNSTTDAIPLHSTGLSLIIKHMKNIKFQEFGKSFLFTRSEVFIFKLQANFFLVTCKD